MAETVVMTCPKCGAPHCLQRLDRTCEVCGEDETAVTISDRKRLCKNCIEERTP